jgi:hypothetical protein
MHAGCGKKPLRNLNRIERGTFPNLIAAEKERGTSIVRNAGIHTNAADEDIVAACSIERLGEAIGRAVIDDANAWRAREKRTNLRLARCACKLKM